ncbi:MAG TPA: alpha/beta fold hydrolase [Thermodesulfobacteriota bacterium]|jgi:3-oxoadipate enol-lactonase
MPRLSVNSINLNYELEGNGSVVVFINGLTMDVNGWYFQVQEFSKRHRVLRYDCRGQGKSDKPDMEYPQIMHAEDLKNLMDKLDIEKAHLVGLSNGGMIAQHFALNFPHKVGALVLVDTCSYIDTLLASIIAIWIKGTQLGGSEFRYDITIPFIFSEDFIKKNKEALVEMKKMSSEINPPNAIINLANGCLKHNTNDRLSEIKAPTLIIVGEEDILIPMKYSKLLNDGIKGSRLVIMKGSGHVPSIEKPEEFNRIVLNFLREYNFIET